MNLLIVYAHPEPRSINGMLKDVAVEVFEAAGWTVEVSDLYGQNFNPAPGWRDFSNPVSPLHLSYAHEQKHAQPLRAYSTDILREQDRLARADLVIFQFPLWWYAVPAMIKGWAERVLSKGFAYDDRHLFEGGLLADKLALVSMTTGATEQELIEDSNRTGTVDEFLKPFTGGVLGFAGMSVFPPFIGYAIDSKNQQERERLLQSYRNRLDHIIEQVGMR